MTQMRTRPGEVLEAEPQSGVQAQARRGARAGSRNGRSRRRRGPDQQDEARHVPEHHVPENHVPENHVPENQVTDNEDPDQGDPGPGRPVKRRGRSHRKAWMAVCLGMVAGVYWLGWHSPLTTVNQLAVVAPKGISAQDVRAASGLTQADHVPAVDGQAVELAIMSRLPAVAAVDVQRRMPHTVNLVVTARQPLAALSMRKGYVLLDPQGVAFDRLAKPPQGLPVMVADSDAGRAAALAVLNSLPVQLRSRVSAIRASTGDNVVLTLGDTSEVRWGSASESALKVAVLASLMQVKARVYDVTAPMMPTTEGSLESPSPTP